jgi:hypothetical protein
VLGRDAGGPAHTAAGDRDQEDEGARDYQVFREYINVAEGNPRRDKINPTTIEGKITPKFMLYLSSLKELETIRYFGNI